MAEKTLDQVLAENATLTSERDTLKATVGTLTGENTTLKADKAKLTTDLATASSTVASLTSERDTLKAENTTLKAEKKTVDDAVAAKVAELGISGGKKGDESAKGSEKLTTTQKALKALGKPLDTKVALGMGPQAAADDAGE